MNQRILFYLAGIFIVLAFGLEIAAKGKFGSLEVPVKQTANDTPELVQAQEIRATSIANTARFFRVGGELCAAGSVLALLLAAWRSNPPWRYFLFILQLLYLTLLIVVR